MAVFKPYKLTNNQLASLTKKEGQFIVVTDTGAIYFDESTSSRIALGGGSSGSTVEPSSTNGNIKIDGVETTVYTHPTTTATSAAAVKVGKDAAGHVVLGNALTASDVGLGNVGNFKAVSTVASQGLTSTEKANARANIGAGTSSLTLGNTSTTAAAGNHTHTASDVGAIASTLKGAANGVAELDANGLVPTSQLPSYVDDVLEYSAKSSFPTTGETGKIYVDTSTNLTWRWSGSTYVEISPSLALGTTSSTAYRGDYGNTAYTHATDANRLTTAQSEGLYKIATTAYGHIKSVTAVQKSDITGLGIPGSDTNTHRPIQVNGTQILGDNTTALNLKAGSNVTVTNSSGTVTIAATDTTYESKTAASGGTAVSLVTTGEKYTWNNKSNLTLGNTSTTAAAGNHTHTTSLATDTGTSSITLAHGSKYKLTAGGSSIIFTMPSSSDTNYYPTAFSWTNGTTSGPTGSLTGSGMSAVSFGAIPAADGTTSSGIVTTGSQTFGGVKTFSSSPKLSTNTLTTSSGYTVTIPNATSTLVNLSSTQSLTNKTYNGYTLAAACAKGVDTTLSSSSTNLPTSSAVATYITNLGILGWDTASYTTDSDGHGVWS